MGNGDRKRGTHAFVEVVARVHDEGALVEVAHVSQELGGRQLELTGCKFKKRRDWTSFDGQDAFFIRGPSRIALHSLFLCDG